MRPRVYDIPQGHHMHAVFVNHCHPETPHVCAVRAREFARAMARRGHRIVLLTGTLNPDDPAERPEQLEGRLEAHDWTAPLVLACRPEGHGLLRRQRAGRLPIPASKLVVGGYYALRGSVFPDWGRGAAPYYPVLARDFRPGIVWANFGNTECLRIGREVAARSGCPWVLDVKDYWSTFVPAPFRRALGRRFGDARAMTALSDGHVADVRRDLPERLTERATTIYSGVPDGLLTGPPAAVAADRIVLVGAIYDPARLAPLMQGLSTAASGCASYGIDYAGDQGDLVAAAAEGVPGVGVTDHGYLPLGRLHELQRRARANVFVRSGPGWFQHKVPELLAAGRPILCLPGADAETTGLAARAGIPFFNCESSGDVANAIAAAGRPSGSAPDRDTLAGLTWSRRTETLERVLEDACR